MTFRMIAVAAALGLGLAGAAHAAPPAAAAKPAAAKPMNYDCTKAGNKNKTACKTAPAATAAAAPAAKPMAMAKPATPAATMAPAKPASMTKSTTTTAAARPSATKTANPNEVAATLKNGKTVHYDCSKAGNKSKTACKTAA